MIRYSIGIFHKGKALFWGWYVTLGAFALMVITYGVRYSFGVFVKPMLSEYDWPMTVIQLGSSVNIFIYACASVLAGWLLDRISPKKVMTAGILLTTAGLIMTSVIKTPLGLYFAYGMLVGAGSAGCGAVICSAAVGKWFDRYRGLAIGTATMGIGVGTMFMAPLAGYIVKHYGWRNGFLSVAFLLLAVGLLVSQVFMGKSRPEEIGLLPDGEKPHPAGPPAGETSTPVEKTSILPVIKTTPFWVIVFCYTFAVMTVMMTFNLQVVYAIQKGIDGLKAAAAIGIIGITGSCGKFYFGWLSDRVRDAKYAASMGLLLMAMGMFLLYQTQTITLLYTFALVYGFGYGSLAPLMPYLISDRFGRQRLGAAYGLLIFFASGFGGGLGPIIGGYIYDKTGAYDLGWILCTVTLLIVALYILTLKRPA